MKASLLEGIFLIMTFLSYLLILSTPFLLSRFIKTNKFFLLLFVSIVLTFILSAVSTYWSEDLSDKLMYILYSFDDSGMSDEERLRNVNEENRTTIQEIYNRSFGIAWPLKLLMMYVILLIPYNVVSCGLIYLFKRRKQSS
jgi:hypothetical protein